MTIRCKFFVINMPEIWLKWRQIWKFFSGVSPKTPNWGGAYPIPSCTPVILNPPTPSPPAVLLHPLKRTTWRNPWLAAQRVFACTESNGIFSRSFLEKFPNGCEQFISEILHTCYMFISTPGDKCIHFSRNWTKVSYCNHKFLDCLSDCPFCC